MKIQLKQIPIRDLVAGYLDKGDNGVVGYKGKLDIRPAYQREMVYKEAQQKAVVESVMQNFPINVMYWVKNGNGFEVLDGQQRTVSICRYITGAFHVKAKGKIQYFHNLDEEQQEQIMSYKILVYFCEGTIQQKLDWFRTINIQNEKLTPQELRNAAFPGTWLADAKKYFSKVGGPAYKIGGNYIIGSPIRQELLEKALKGISDNNIEEYMATKQHEENSAELWNYYMEVVQWIKDTFPNLRKREMQGVDWFSLYNEFKSNLYDSSELEKKIVELMKDDDVTVKKGIYPYLLSGSEKHLSLRAFTPSQIASAYERQKGICPIAVERGDEKTHFLPEEMEADHIIPWSQGGKTTPDNLQMLCKKCNREKSDK